MSWQASLACFALIRTPEPVTLALLGRRLWCHWCTRQRLYSWSLNYTGYEYSRFSHSSTPHASATT